MEGFLVTLSIAVVMAFGGLIGAAISSEYPAGQTKDRIICQDYFGGSFKEDVCIKDGKVISTKGQK